MRDYKIKVCGMTRRDNLKQVLALDVHAVGVISFAASPRHMPISEAAQLMDAAKEWAPDVERHWVVRDCPVDRLESALVQGLACTHVQLHGDYGLAAAQLVRAQGKKVVQVHTMAHAVAPTVWLETDRLLLDTPGPLGGGTGRVFDRSLFASWQDPGVEVTLAGGLGASEASAKLQNVPHWIGWLDLNSGVEASPGIKNPHRIQSFIQQLAS